MTVRPDPPVHASGIDPWAPDPATSPPVHPDAEPAGFIVVADGDVRLHFHDWGGRSPTTAGFALPSPHCSTIGPATYCCGVEGSL